jgi:hypothetical protein
VAGLPLVLVLVLVRLAASTWGGLGLRRVVRGWCRGRAGSGRQNLRETGPMERLRNPQQAENFCVNDPERHTPQVDLLRSSHVSVALNLLIRRSLVLSKERYSKCPTETEVVVLFFVLFLEPRTNNRKRQSRS